MQADADARLDEERRANDEGVEELVASRTADIRTMLAEDAAERENELRNQLEAEHMRVLESTEAENERTISDLQSEVDSLRAVIDASGNCLLDTPLTAATTPPSAPWFSLMAVFVTGLF